MSKVADRNLVVGLDIGTANIKAIVGEVIEDHLDRNEIPHETFKKVKYESPPDQIRLSSDFDVISLIGDIFVAVECKTGLIDQGALTAVESNATDIKSILTKQLGDNMRFHFFLVYDPFLNDEMEVTDIFSDASVSPLKPDQIRELMQDLAPLANR